MSKKELGQWGEEKAALHMENLGYTILAKNYRCKKGEVDLIVSKGQEIIGIEVKTRRSKQFGMPREAVDKRKQQHIKNTVLHYLMLHNVCDYNLRFDVIEVYFESSIWQLCHIKYCF